MILNIVFIAFLSTVVHGINFNCNHENAVASFKRPTYDFSVRFLDRVAQQTNYHFVFSPLSTWLQLMSLAEGARGPTQTEIWKVTRHHRMKCFRRKFREILNSMDDELSFMTKRTNVIVINKLLDVKESFEEEVKKTNTTKLFSLNFNDPAQAVAKLNKAIDMDLNDVGSQFDVNDFNLTVLLMTDTAYFKSDWWKPFNPVYTSTETFYSEENIVIGKVRMMQHEEYFNLTEVPLINARVLELPFNSNGRLSMLVFLPTRGTVLDLFYNLKNIRLTTIFNLYNAEREKFVRVQLPRFKILSELRNIPELVYDMGVKRIFYPDLADLGGITDYPVYASLMTQIADIEITEQGARPSIIPDSLIMKPEHDSIVFSANRPFAFLIVDRLTEAILFGGLYRYPSIH
ncbi:serine protease inhibitor 77Ba-like [Bicyclus anynana]|uniref:Serine protease inhibitor 77Ba-like n=1 Tax=Bicyclus anynana TaxID=110368 RepID=A0A6J1NP26_BICAN|nr:serine protease inhibitor 77Ba-like [Bicyclus anynana]